MEFFFRGCWLFTCLFGQLKFEFVHISFWSLFLYIRSYALCVNVCKFVWNGRIKHLAKCDVMRRACMCSCMCRLCMCVVSLIVNCLCSIKKYFNWNESSFFGHFQISNKKTNRNANNKSIDQAKIIQRDKKKPPKQNQFHWWNHEQLLHDFTMKYLMRDSPITASGGSHTNFVPSHSIRNDWIAVIAFLSTSSLRTRSLRFFFILTPAFIFFLFEICLLFHSLFAYKYSTRYIERIVCMSWWEWECEK